jgi:hypothetical protein
MSCPKGRDDCPGIPNCKRYRVSQDGIPLCTGLDAVYDEQALVNQSDCGTHIPSKDATAN